MNRNVRLRDVSRRYFLNAGGLGLGAAALSGLLPRGVNAAGPSLATSVPNKSGWKSPRARHVIYLHMAGAPSQLDLFDYKPELQKLSGKPCPPSFLEGKRFAFIKGVPNMLGTFFKFQRHGQSGAELSQLLPSFARVVDKVAIVKSVHTTEFNHAPAQLLALTGRSQFGGASMGSWVSYGLGSENKDLPAYVVLLSGGKNPDGGKSLWGSGFLPSVYQGVACRSEGEPVLFVADPPGLDRQARRETLDTLGSLNAQAFRVVGDPEIQTRMEQYELAYRMQMSVPSVMDISKEPQHILKMYGAVPGYKSKLDEVDDPRTLYTGTDPTFANNCVLARRLVEQGVRFVQIFDWGWDHHGISAGESIDQTLPIKAKQVDKAMTALLLDLEQRGLLDETLVVWGGEFGRTPMQQNFSKQPFIGRDHHPDAYTIWLAGGGIKAGQTYGATDEFGYNITQNPVHLRDLQATILHLLGLDPYRFSYPFQGLDQRLIGPDATGKIVSGLVA